MQQQLQSAAVSGVNALALPSIPHCVEVKLLPQPCRNWFLTPNALQEQPAHLLLSLAFLLLSLRWQYESPCSSVLPQSGFKLHSVLPSPKKLGVNFGTRSSSAAPSTFSASEGIGMLQWCASWDVKGPHRVWQKELLGEWLELEAQGLVNRVGDDQEVE